MSETVQQSDKLDQAKPEGVGSSNSVHAPMPETGTKRPRSNSLEAAAAQALTQLDGPPHLRQNATTGFQPILGPPQPMHPSQYANAFSAGQNVNQQQADPTQYSTLQMSQSPVYRQNSGTAGSPLPIGQPSGSPAGGRAPGAHQARQRTAVACRYCRKRKIRCTGISHDPNDPRCSNCRRLDQECIYAPVGAPQGNYTRQPMPDGYGRAQPFHAMPQPGMGPGPQQQQQQQWQSQPMGYPPQTHYLQYSQGRGMPIGADGQHQFPQGQAYAPGPGYPGQQHYQYDNNYPNFVNESNAAHGHGQFGRLKPETFAIYPSPSSVNQPMPIPTDVQVLDPAMLPPESSGVENPAQSHEAQEGQDLPQAPQEIAVAPELLDPKEGSKTDAEANGPAQAQEPSNKPESAEQVPTATGTDGLQEISENQETSAQDDAPSVGEPQQDNKEQASTQEVPAEEVVRKNGHASEEPAGENESEQKTIGASSTGEEVVEQVAKAADFTAHDTEEKVDEPVITNLLSPSEKW